MNLVETTKVCFFFSTVAGVCTYYNLYIHICHALHRNFTRPAMRPPHPDVKTSLFERLLPIEKGILFESGSNL